MHAFWCTEARKSSICQYRDLMEKMRAATPEEKKTFSDKIRKLRSTKTLAKEYQEMKMAYCASNPTGAKTLCATAASQYKTAGASSQSPGAATSPVVMAITEVTNWWCSRRAGPTEQANCEKYKKRQSLLSELRQSGLSLETRNNLNDQLKTLPPMPYATQQAIFADFCKVAAHADKPSCTRVKQTQASISMRKWYCKQSTNAQGNWCKRSTLFEKLQKIPAASTDPAQIEHRKTLLLDLRSFSASKPAVGGGVSVRAQIAKEIVEAKKQYCAVETNRAIPYCDAPAPSQQ